MSDIKRHRRVNGTLTAPAERAALQWLAARSPSWITPDALTALGVAGSVMCFLGYWFSSHDELWLWLVNAGMLVNWYGDSLDGTLARYRGTERPKFGFYIDHTVDAISEFLTIIGVGMSPFLRLDIAAFALIGYLLMSVHVYIRTAVDGVFKISFGIFGPTELRIIIVAVNIAILMFTDWFLAPLVTVGGVGLKPVDLIGVFIAVSLSLVFLVASLKHAAVLAREGK